MDVLIVILLTIFIVECITGISGNVLIAVVKIMDWVKRKKNSLMDQIFIALAISRITLIFYAAITILIYIIYLDFSMSKKASRIAIPLWAVFNHFNIWFAACLNVFYFLRIANFSNSAFLYLKWRVNKVVLVTFMGSLIFFLLNTMVVNAHVDAWILGNQSNMSYTSSRDTAVQFSKHYLLTDYTFTLIPFIVSLMTLLLLIISLWKHRKNMQHNWGDASRKAHIKALRTVSTFLSLYAVILLFLLLQISRLEVLEESIMFTVDHLIAIALPSVHSCVLILIDSKLRQAALKVLCWLRCNLKGS